MEQENECSIPLQNQRVFGAGIKRKRVSFVPASSTPSAPLTSTNAYIEDRYLSIVFPSTEPASADDGKETTGSPEGSESQRVEALGSRETHRNGPVCEICRLPIQEPELTDLGFKIHQATIAHQVCLPHSFPPSHLDRRRQGLKYLSSYGWDPDSRSGLGATGEGIRAPIKVKIKNDTVGLGVKRPEKGSVVKRSTARVHKLNAKQVRDQELEAKKKGASLRELFYHHDDVERYLGSS